MSISSAFFAAYAPKLCRTNFLSSFIFKSLSLYSFSFYFSINNFFSSSSFFCSYSISMALIFYCHNFSYYLLSCSRIPISSSRLDIISGVMDWIGFFAFNLSLAVPSLCSNSLSFYCFPMYCSWFFLKIFSASATFSFIPLASSFTLTSYFFKS